MRGRTQVTTVNEDEHKPTYQLQFMVCLQYLTSH